MHTTNLLFLFSATLPTLAKAANPPPRPETTTTTTLKTSTCPRNSATACPSVFDPCCAYLCAEAQVPFLICSPENQTVLAQCTPCSTPAPTPSFTTVTITPTITIPPHHVGESTCSTSAGYSATGCPKSYSPCCKFLCAEAQVPFALCSGVDGSGQFASCSACPTGVGGI